MACIKRKRGRWVVDFYDQNGKRREKWTPKGANKTQAKKLLREIEEQVYKGTFMPDLNIPLFSEVAQKWIEYKKPNLRASTWSVYEGHSRNHFHDLDPLKINRINTATIEKFITDKQNSGMHILTLRKILVTLGQIMAYAVRHRYIDYNPLRDAERPRGQGAEKSKKIRILTPIEINAFLNAVEDRKYRTLFKVSIFTGARQGEVFGLKWSDIEWQNKQIHIQRTFNNQAWYQPKSETSIRRIDLGPFMIAELKAWQKVCPTSNLDLIFPNEAGQAINHNNMVNRHFNPALKKVGIDKIRFHDLRHTYASLLIEQGENVKYIQSQLGHSSPTVTLNVYAHLMKPANQESACRLENTILGTNGDQMETFTKKEVRALAVTS